MNVNLGYGLLGLLPGYAGCELFLCRQDFQKDNEIGGAEGSG